MPITASAKKSLRVGLRRAQENRITKQRVKNQLKHTTPETLGAAFSILDKSAKNHIIHPNKAARLKSRLSRRMAAVAVPVPAPKPKRTRAPKKV